LIQVRNSSVELSLDVRRVNSIEHLREQFDGLIIVFGPHLGSSESYQLECLLLQILLAHLKSILIGLSQVVLIYSEFLRLKASLHLDLLHVSETSLVALRIFRLDLSEAAKT
jgi:hypothetical protein